MQEIEERKESPRKFLPLFSFLNSPKKKKERKREILQPLFIALKDFVKFK